jgi:hypothetical protein
VPLAPINFHISNTYKVPHKSIHHKEPQDQTARSPPVEEDTSLWTIPLLLFLRIRISDRGNNLWRNPVVESEFDECVVPVDGLEGAICFYVEVGGCDVGDGFGTV